MQLVASLMVADRATLGKDTRNTLTEESMYTSTRFCTR